MMQMASVLKYNGNLLKTFLVNKTVVTNNCTF